MFNAIYEDYTIEVPPPPLSCTHQRLENILSVPPLHLRLRKTRLLNINVNINPKRLSLTSSYKQIATP